MSKITKMHKEYNIFGIKIKLRDRNKELSEFVNQNTKGLLINIKELGNQISFLNKCFCQFYSAIDNNEFFSIKESAIKDLIKRRFSTINKSPEFNRRIIALIKNLDENSKETILKIINRSILLGKNDQQTNIFTQAELMELKNIYDFQRNIFEITKNIYSYKSYLLPLKHFESSVFLYNHGIHLIKNCAYFKQKNIIDVGAYIGDSALIFSSLTDKKVYSFEATKENYNYLLETIKLNSLNNVIPENYALGEKSGKIKINFYGGASSASNIDLERSKYTEICKMISLDEYVKRNNLDVGLIKVDIEGAEQSFLKGAINTIKTQRPILLISIYHNIDDFLDIKPMIESWKLDYTFKIFKPTDGSIIDETLLICEPNKIQL